jgi:hypothetical protein
VKENASSVPNNRSSGATFDAGDADESGCRGRVRLTGRSGASFDAGEADERRIPKRS